MSWLWVIIGAVWVLGMPVAYSYRRRGTAKRPDMLLVVLWFPFVALFFLVWVMTEISCFLSDAYFWLAQRRG